MSRRSGALGERWVHLFPFSLSPPFFSIFFLFQNKRRGSLGTDYSCLHRCLSAVSPADQRAAADGNWWDFRKGLGQGGLQRSGFTGESVSRKISFTPSQWVTFPAPQAVLGQMLISRLCYIRRWSVSQEVEGSAPPPLPWVVQWTFSRFTGPLNLIVTWFLGF